MENKTKLLHHKLMKNLLLLFVMILSVSSVMAQRQITGKVAENGQSLPGASVLLKGTDIGAITDENGMYSISVPNEGGTLVITYVGFADKEIEIGTQSVIDVELSEDDGLLQEVVVTGYQELRKRDITGAVTVVQTDDLKAIKGSSFTQALAGRATGVTISTSGSPGDATNVRIRGISSFGNNDPLYIIDGVPVQDQYQNLINPEDIESMQVLKDAATSSIYGSRASNGVIVITTKKGKSGKTKVSYNSSVGSVSSVKGYDQTLNTSSEVYAEAMRRKFAKEPGSIPAYATTPNSLPKYIQPIGNTVDEKTYDILNNQITLLNTAGTNWWKEMTRPAMIQDHNVNIAGGNDFATFNFSGGYFGQEGVLKHTDYNRASIRMNSVFKAGKNLRFGENVMYAGNWGTNISSTGGSNNEQGPIGNLLKATPVVSVRDIKGNPGGHLTASSGNFTNPDQILIDNKDNTNKYNRLLGNVFAEADIISGLTARTSFGVDLGQGFNKGFTYPQPYRAEGAKTANGFREGWSTNNTWTWTNTLQYKKNLDKHSFAVLAGQEAIAYNGRNIGASLANYFVTDINGWYINTGLADQGSRSVGSGGSSSRLASMFGKVDYSFDDKYLVSGTIRRDGSSKFLSDIRYGVFPAVSVGWRVSGEDFLKDVTWLNDLKLRASYGEVGNQQIRDYNFTDIYGGGVASTFYDINGNGGAATGYALVSRGNPGTRWESSNSKNIGLDASIMGGAFGIVLDLYERETNDLLFAPALPGTAGSAAPPTVNVGAMVNTGVDLGLTYRKRVSSDLEFNAALNLSHYKNEIVKIADNSDRFYSGGLASRVENADQTFINLVGSPISSFNGFLTDGLITTEAEKATQLPGSQIGGLKFKDINGDGKITTAGDIGVMGSPHPDLTGGLNLGVTFKNLDINAFLFGSLGNQIYNYTKMFNYFTNFNSNVSKNFLEIEGTGNNPKVSSLDAISRSSSDFYLEDGSYLRLANLQLGYNLPKSAYGKLGLGSARVYIQGQNMLTFTGYSGVDPAVSNANIGNSGNVNDTTTGFDGGNYPANKIVNVGINLNF
jgi:TonB-dependent starch-binding outer membrane protein SusC